MQVVKETFWYDLNGRMVCQKHIGCEATCRLEKRPSAKTIKTSMTKWFKITEEEVKDFAELVCRNQSICESCRYSA